jgi:hypothetical protein
MTLPNDSSNPQNMSRRANVLGWIFAGWIALVVSFYTYHMLRSFF